MDNKVVLALLDALVEEAVSKIVVPEGQRGLRGLRGRDGNDFRLEDHSDLLRSFIVDNLPKTFELTDEQIALLKGEPGKDGQDGSSFALEDHIDAIRNLILENTPKTIELSDEQISLLKGEPGRNGRDGQDGSSFALEDHIEEIREAVLASVPKTIELTDEQITLLKGEPGKDGRSFNLEDWAEEIESLVKKHVPDRIELTDEQKEELRGPQGQDGVDGRRGKDGRDFDFEEHRESIEAILREASLKFDDLTDEQKEELRGLAGRDGRDGEDFSFDESREEINNLIVGYLSQIKDTLALRFDDLTEDQKQNLRGPRGQRGKQGRDFDLEEASPLIQKQVNERVDELVPELKLKFSDLSEGEKDTLKLKFEHLSAEDRLTLRGPRGQRGKPGNQGEDGKEGPQGPEGKVGPRGPRGPIGPSGVSGKTGPEGARGRDGKDGQDAPRVVDVKVEQSKDNFQFVFEFDDGDEITTNKVTIPKAQIISYTPVFGGGGSGGGTTTPPPATTVAHGIPHSEYFILTIDQVNNRKITLLGTPIGNKITLTPEGALPQRYGIDFEYIPADNSVSWSGLGLHNMLEPGEYVEVSYTAALIEETDSFTITQEVLDAARVYLSSTPVTPIRVRLEGETYRRNTIDFQYDSGDNYVTWAGLGLDGYLEVGDVLEVSYFHR